jgi:uncharacterized membrane protein
VIPGDRVSDTRVAMRRQRARNTALLVGVGLGGFLDGITLHQIAHWH